MRRFGVINQIVLILMCVLLAVVVGALSFNRWQQAHFKPAVLKRASHMAQAAGIMDTVLRAKPDDLSTILRAVSGHIMRADIVTQVPPLPDGLTPAPHVTAKVRSLMAMPAPGLETYTDGVQWGLAYKNEALEGVLRRAVLPLGPQRYLVIGVIVFPRPYAFDFFGLPEGFWIGLVGVLLAALTLVAALREAAPLRRLTEAVSRFDGRAPQALAGSPNDVSEIGRLIAAVDDMQKRVTSLLRERSFLIGAISHDAKTYLTRMRLRSESIRDPSSRAALIGDVEAMTELLETSLAYARGTTITNHRGKIDLADLVAAECAEREAVGTTVALRTELAEAAVVDGDPVSLKRVVANLIDNAVKFGAAHVDVSVRVDADTCSVIVDDDGPGIAESERHVVFTPFYRVEKSRNRQTGGTGLGLAIARQIIEAHGGTIEAMQAPKGGARLVVMMPASSRWTFDGNTLGEHAVDKART